MNILSLIQKFMSEGVKLSASPDGKLNVTGPAEAVSRWRPTLSQHKAEILMALEEEAIILGWLSSIGEDDPVTIDEVMNRCREDGEARQYFLMRGKTNDQ